MHAPTDDTIADTSDTTRRPGWTPGRALVVIVVLALVLFWIWIFSGGPAKRNPDYLGDRSWVTRTEQTCAETVADIERLPRAGSAATAEARAVVLDQATDRLTSMVRRLSTNLPDDGDEARLVRMWLADWRAYLVNRRAYALALRSDPDARLLVDEKFDDPIDRVIDTFAEVNAMKICTTPDDVA